MQFADEFTVERPIDAVWGLFQDVDSVARCLPGAEITGDKGGGTYDGRVSVKLGPLNPTFEGEATAVYDIDNRSIQLAGSGIDHKGGSRGRVGVTVDVREAGAATAVSVDATITLSGAAARFGRTGLMEEMAKRLINEFVACLEAKLAAGTVAEAAAVEGAEIKGFSLFLASVGSWFKRLLRRLSMRR